MAAASTTNPFPGLRPFDFADRDFFFGREGQIRELRRKLKSNHFIAVVGSSGCGKSSLVRAGLFKYLDQEGGWRWVTMRPQGEPLDQLARAILAFRGRDEAMPFDILLDRTETALRRSSSGVVDLLAEGAAEPGGPILIVIDQFEELFRFERLDDQLRYADEAQAFVRLLLRAARSPELPIHVILTMRSDFLGDCARFPGLPEAINDSQFLVPRLTRDQRRQVIERPIKKVGAGIEPALLQRLLNDVGDDPDQLPVLQHVLMRTWQVAARESAMAPATTGLAEAPATFDSPHADATHVLKLAHYEHADVGGMDEALSNHADAVLEAVEGERSELAAKQIFGALVDLDREGRAIRRTPPPRLAELVAIVGDEDRAMAVIEAFRATGCSFLVPSFDDLPEIDGDRRVDIAHEALIRRWIRISGADGAHGWLAAEADDGRIYQRLLDFIDEFGAERALGADEAARRVPWWSPDRRNAAWAERYGGRFDEVSALIARSKVALRWAKARKAAVYLLPFLAAAAVGAFVMYMQEHDLRKRVEQQTNQLRLQATALRYQSKTRQEALEARKEAENAKKTERSRILAKQSREATTAGDAATGLALALAAIEGTDSWLPTAEAEQSIYLALRDLREAQLLGGHDLAILAAGFSPDGDRIVSGSDDHTVRAWDAASGAELLVLRHGGPVLAAGYSPDGARIVSGAGDNTVRVWNAASGEELRVLRGHEQPVWAADYSPDGGRIVSGSEDGTVRVWDAASGEALLVLRGHEGWVNAAGYSPDGGQIVSGSEDGTVRVWDAASGAELLVLRGHEGWVNAAGYSPDGARIVSGADDGTVRMWDAVSGEPLLILGHEGPVYAAGYSSDGSRIVSGAGDGTVRVWDAASGEALLVLRGQGMGEVWAATFSPDGAYIVSGSEDAVVRVWRARGALEATTYRDVRPPAGPSGGGKGDAVGRVADQIKTRSVVGYADAAPPPVAEPAAARALVALADDGTAGGWAASADVVFWSSPDVGSHDAVSSRPLALHLTDRRLLTLGDRGDLLALGAEEQRHVPLDLGDVEIAGAAFSALADRLVVLTAEGEILEIATEEGTVTSVAETAAGAVTRAAVDLGSDGASLLIALDDGRALVRVGGRVDLRQGVEGRALDASADQGLVATAQATRGGDRVIVWRASDGEVAADLPIPAEDGQVLDAAISPDGKRALTVTTNGPVRLWDLADSSAPIAIFGRAADRFRGAAFAPDGRRVAAAMANGGLKVWSIFASRAALIEAAKALAPRELSFAQRCQYGLVADAECQEAEPLR